MSPTRSAATRERALEEWVEDAMRKLGWLRYHTRWSIQSERGFPDLCAVRGQRCLFVELKTDTGQLSYWQEQWAAALTACPGVEYALWRPADWFDGTIAEALR